MRLAIFSDIHGNLVAFEAALAEMKRAAPDAMVCLGDVAETGPQPRECLALLRDLNCPVVMGNTDERIVTRAPVALRHDDDIEARNIQTLDEWCVEQLAPEHVDFVRTFKPTVEIDLGGQTAVCFHGSPRYHSDIIVATTPDDELAPMLGEREALVFAGGHTHAQMLRRFRRGFMMNPGSVGLPYETTSAGGVVNPAHAEFALVTLDDHRLSIELRRAPFSLDALRASVAASAMPLQEWYLKDWSG